MYYTYTLYKAENGGIYMSASWEIDEENLISSEKCLCGQGTIDYYEVKLSHTKVLREKTEHKTVICCPNPKCPSKQRYS